MSKFFVFLIFFFIFLCQPKCALGYELTISDNGSDSSSQAIVQLSNSVNVLQTNNSSIQNDVFSNTNTGSNLIDQSGDEVNVKTGDAKISQTAINLSNQNGFKDNCCETAKINQQVNINNNGSNSTNTVSSSSNLSNNFVSQNSAVIKTKIVGVANTGLNKANDNSRNTKITTGDVKVVTSVKNGPINSSISSLPANLSEDASSFRFIDNAYVGGSSANNFKNLKNNVFVENSSVILNEVFVDANSGENFIGGNLGDSAIITGDIFLDILLRNDYINSNFISFNCCFFDNGDDPDDPPTVPEDSIIKNPNDGSANNNNANFLSKTSFLGENAIGGGEILGLSKTSSEKSLDLNYLFGILFLVLGLGMIIDSAGKASENENKLPF
ncbi:MAG: hypothetical protein N2558_00795 [Patescibacteria group bacterium]|nr:hypothetical protein [Patescibacteria group bacterium]